MIKNKAHPPAKHNIMELNYRKRNEMALWAWDMGWKFGKDIQYQGFDSWHIPDDHKYLIFLLRWQ
jgi:hypothetical protein